MDMRLFATKSVESLCADAEAGQGFKRELGAWELILLGIGVVIGTGIFVLTGRAAAVNAGPAVALSFALAGVAATLGALCYAEMASMLPVAGSAYTYAYATLGELVAFMIGWDLILEYMVGAATVSVGWSGYVVAFVQHVTGYRLPSAWTSAPFVWDEVAHTVNFTGAYINLPAVLIIGLISTVLVVGIRASARVNAKLVFIKLTVILLFICFAASHVQPSNWLPFIPPNTGTFGHFGWSGIFQGATMVFFAYLGVDNISTAAQEAKDPQRNIPIAILATLAICTVLYIAVSVILTGVVRYDQLSVPHPIAVGIAATGIGWLTTAVEIGAIAGLTSVMLVQLFGQPRIFYAMAKDGLLPAVVAKVHPKFGTPHITTLTTGALCALGGGLLPIDILGELTSIGTLFAFVLVSLGVMVLRKRRPDVARRFRVPGGPYLVPLLSAAMSLGLMSAATWHTLMRLFVWMAVGLSIYFLYGRHHSLLNTLR